MFISGGEELHCDRQVVQVLQMRLQAHVVFLSGEDSLALQLLYFSLGKMMMVSKS